MRLVYLTISVLAVVVGTRSARSAQTHNDVVPYALDGKIVAGGHNDILNTNVITERVFGYDFGEDPSDPYVVGDPGFNNGSGFTVGVFPNDGLLPANVTLGFDLITNLQYWDGTGVVSFSAAQAGVELGIQRGSNTVLVSGSGQSGSVPTISGTGLAGRVHVHVQASLNFSDGTNLAPPNAPDGIYLVGLQLKLPGSGVANSDSIYFVYNNNLDESLHDAAIDWAESHLAPEPATWLLMLSALVALAAMRKRRRESLQSEN